MLICLPWPAEDGAATLASLPCCCRVHGAAAVLPCAIFHNNDYLCVPVLGKHNQGRCILTMSHKYFHKTEQVKILSTLCCVMFG